MSTAIRAARARASALDARTGGRVGGHDVKRPGAGVTAVSDLGEMPGLSTGVLQGRRGRSRGSACGKVTEYGQAFVEVEV
jgi:hypothetical protein